MSQKDDNSQEDDIQFEENLEDRAGEAADMGGKLKKLREELKKCQTERAEYLAGWQRAKADYINLKKEHEDNRHEIGKWAKEGVLTDLFTLADSFEMAFANKEAWEQAPANWRQGIEYIYNQLETILKDHGIEEIIPKVGDKFNHHTEHSVATVPAESEDQDDLVAEVTKKGYKIKDKILRPASVKVYRFDA